MDNKTVSLFKDSLHDEIKSMVEPESLNSILNQGGYGRVLLQNALNTLTSVEEYIKLRNHSGYLEVATTLEAEVAATLEAEDETKSDKLLWSEAMEEAEKEGTNYVTDNENIEWREAKIIRKAHGATVDFGNSELKNIPESVVLKFNIGHGAVVLSRITSDFMVEIKEVVSRGDDSLSSIVTKVGYLERDFNTWYCIPQDNPNMKYEVFYKDTEVLNVKVGMVCSFNIDKKAPRVVRLSRIHATPEEEVGGNTDTKPTPKLHKEKDDSCTDFESKSIEPFLEGCLVAVIGGERKWFETTVNSTGADFLHDDGRSPKRITSQLQKAQVLFILQTSVSHEAYWDCKEVAKQNDIPMFSIEGSKSSLLRDLEDNKGLILSANR